MTIELWSNATSITYPIVLVHKESGRAVGGIHSLTCTRSFAEEAADFEAIWDHADMEECDVAKGSINRMSRKVATWTEKDGVRQTRQTTYDARALLYLGTEAMLAYSPKALVEHARRRVKGKKDAQL